MKALIRVIGFVVALMAIGSCNSLMNNPAVVPVPNLPLDASSGFRYIYVVEYPGNDMLVYPAGVPNPSPMRVVRFDDIPMCVISDHEGNVYVSLLHDGKVLKYDSGATKLVSRYEIEHPRGMAVDANDSLYVASDAGVRVYAHGHTRTNIGFNSIGGELVSSIALDSKGDVFLDTLNPRGGAHVQEFPTGGIAPFITSAIGAGTGGVAFNFEGRLDVGSPNEMLQYRPPAFSFDNVQRFNYGISTEVGCLTGVNGAVYVPVYNPVAHTSKVMVYPASAAAPYAITQGLTASRGATAGY